MRNVAGGQEVLRRARLSRPEERHMGSLRDFEADKRMEEREEDHSQLA